MRFPMLLRAILFSLSLPCAAFAADAYFNLRVPELVITEGKLPEIDESARPARFRSADAYRPYVSLDGPGDAYYVPPTDAASDIRSVQEGSIVIRGPKGQHLDGSLYVPNSDMTGMVRVRFKALSAAADVNEEVNYLKAKQQHYQRLAARGIAGAAWFRHRARTAARDLGGPQAPDGTDLANNRNDELDRTYALFSGGRALSENLQLERALPTRDTKPSESGVELDSIEGITVAAMDWQDKLKDPNRQLDPLATVMPADQYAFFFPSFNAAMSVLDEAERRGTPLLHLAEPRSEDAGTKQRYERQLGLSLTAIGRLVGPQVVKSMALTGSDPYFRVGSELAVVFEAHNKDILKQLLQVQITQSAQGRPDARQTTGKVGQIETWSLATPDRTINSFLGVIGSAVVVTNSIHQLEKMAAAQETPKVAMAQSPEYHFFRERYRLGDPAESAFLVLTDATIRVWCGPRLRIADSRRTRAAAVLSELQSTHFDPIAKRSVRPGPIYNDVPGLGDVQLTPLGVSSSVYGRLDSMTPIPDILGADDKVTKDEAEAYERWRDTYQRNWRAVFDPIAIRLTTSREKLAADTTVMPLIAGTDYRQMIDVSRGGQLGPSDGDPHGAPIHYVMALNPKSAMLRSGANFLGSMAPGQNVNPLSWIGGSVALYVDDDPFWEELAKAENGDDFMEKQFHRAPVAVNIAVKNKLGLAGFLVALRGMADQTAPGMLVWEALEHEKHPYVKVTATDDGVPQGLRRVAIYYSTTDSGLVISLNENVLKRAIDRSKARKLAAKKGDQPPKDPPWLGESAAVQVTRRAVEILRTASTRHMRDELQERAWSNLPILNEWRQIYPAEDPIVIHQRLWHVTVVDPAGGQYRWNDHWQTYESTTYGHPGEPKEGPPTLMAIDDLVRAGLGVTFEENGLRARVELERAK